MSERRVVEQVWQKLRLYLFIEWDRLRDRIQAGRIDEMNASSRFRKRFGDDRLAYHFEGHCELSISDKHTERMAKAQKGERTSKDTSGQ